METPFVETDCTVSHDGHTFESGGAVITEDRAVAYLELRSGHFGYEPGNLTDWHGHRIGTYTVLSSWPTPNSYVSTRRYSIHATINGRSYYGRTQGPGMVAFLKAYVDQKGGK